MTLRTLIIDDEPIALEKLKTYAGRLPQLSLVAACADGLEALRFLGENDIDLIITDISMPDLNGLDFVKSLRHRPLVIFTTAYPQYAIEGYKVAAVDYLLKPYGFAEFSQAVAMAEQRITPSDSKPKIDSIFIKADTRFIRISLADIQFIKGYGEYLQVFIAGKTTPVLTLSSFAAIKEKLSSDFIQIHRSYIVNINHVEQIERNRVVMDQNTQLPVGESFKADFQEFILTHSIGKK